MANILIVDDSATIQAAMARTLEKNGHEIILADNGEQGVEMAKSEMPDIVIMDVVMPGINGFQATRQITKGKTTSHIPVVLVSTKSQETDKRWGERQGASTYLVKPVPEDILISTVQDLLEQH